MLVASLSRQKNPGLSPGKRYAVQRIGAFGQSNRMSGNGTTLLLEITPAQRVGWAGVNNDARFEAWRVKA
jgi:hypothetical protein